MVIFANALDAGLHGKVPRAGKLSCRSYWRKQENVTRLTHFLSGFRDQRPLHCSRSLLPKLLCARPIVGGQPPTSVRRHRYSAHIGRRFATLGRLLLRCRGYGKVSDVSSAIGGCLSHDRGPHRRPLQARKNHELYMKKSREQC